MIQLPLDVSHLPRDETILVACSGGADSLALLLSLRQREYSCVAAHINHSTRGKENDDDEIFVRDVCEKLKIPFAVARLNMKADSSEAVLRDARYASLIELAQENACSRIATAHHANDVLETMILNLLRDATNAGWCGIAPQRTLAKGRLLVRPLLAATREEIVEFLKTQDCDWREDSSNRNPRFLRNRVRHEVIPKLVEISGGDATRMVLQAVRGAEILREDFSVLEALAKTRLEALTLCAQDNLLILDGLKFRELPTALQRRVLRLAFENMESHMRDISFEKVETTRLHVAQNKRRAVWMWKKDLAVEWTGAMAGNRIRFKRV